MSRCLMLALLSLFATISPGSFADSGVPENLYSGDLVSYPGPWAFQLPHRGLILVSDAQLVALTNPDQEVDISLTGEPRVTTLRQVCEQAQAAGVRTLKVAFDHFFSQYRKGQEGQTRALTPDTPAYIEHIATISKFAQQYGLGLELSLLSPLEIGAGYARETGESGVWAHYRKGLRDPETGAYSVQLWRQQRWSNNKGPISLEDAGVRVFAFRERGLGGGTRYRVVRPEEIVEITGTAQVEAWPTVRKQGDYEAVRIRVHGSGHTELDGYTRVLVVQRYRTPEMDYFSPQALPYLKGLVDRYADAGVLLHGLYADEMHIQQDWGYFNHHDNGTFALRYASPGFIDAFARQHSEEYRDFEKYLVYFAYGQEDFANDTSAKQDIMHVWGDTPAAVRETALFRSRYYKFLQNGVVDLFVAAKEHAEQRMGHKLEARAHATWAQSPTIDQWNHPGQPRWVHSYDYSSSFVWSNTVQQAASACYDYFKWGDFLTGNGNDHAEGGWLDRNYYGLMLACSTGIVNDVPYSYGAHWGMPHEVAERRQAVVNTFGAASHPAYAMVQNMEHRDVDVLMLYPLDLVAVDERFGSWMNQYAYANVLTAEKLLEQGKVIDGALELGGRRFSTLVALFEPFPTNALLDMVEKLAETGGRVVWSGPPPVLNAEGQYVLDRWQALFGLSYAPGIEEGLPMPGRKVAFEGALDAVESAAILTDFIVDRVYPTTPNEGVEILGRIGNDVVATRRMTAGASTLTYLGFRPRDDQSRSMGYEIAQWYGILSALGAYAPTTHFDTNDNTEHLSRTGPWVTCRFPNGAIAIAPHLLALEENWPGGFIRDREQDVEIVAKLDLPSDRISMQDYRVNGHTITYEGRGAMTFRLDTEGRLEAFAGQDCTGITINGTDYVFSEQPLALLAWAPVAESRRVPGGAVLQLMAHGSGEVRVPGQAAQTGLQMLREGPTPGSRGDALAANIDADGTLSFRVEDTAGRWTYLAATVEP